MGISTLNLQWMWPLLPVRKHGLTMLELGNQHLRTPEAPFADFPRQFLGRPSAKLFFSGIYGFDHVSIDKNGRDGALRFDLSASINLGRRFDVVTDFGTSEHVGPDLRGLWQCLENMHRHTYVGGLLFHANPAPGSWPGHGLWYRRRDFYDRLAPLAGCTVLDVRSSWVEGDRKGEETLCCLRKTAPFFPTFEEFERLGVEVE